MKSNSVLINWYSLILLVFLAYSCKSFPEETVSTYQKLELEYTESPISLGNVEAKVVTDMAYKNFDNTIFDIFLPISKKPTALVIYIHGGGFVNGKKERAYEYHGEDIPKFLEKGIAFATIGYRFIQDVDNGVIDCMNDSKFFLQFIRHHAPSFNLDPERVAMFGQSAGAGTSLWIGLSDDMAEDTDDPILSQSTRLKAIGAFRTQATYDILRWEEVFAEYTIDMSRIPPVMMDQLVRFYGIEDSKLLDTENMISYRKKVDMLELISADDPPLLVMNDGKDGPPLFTDPQHHPMHAKILKEYAEKHELKHEVFAEDLGMSSYPEGRIVAFFNEHLQ
jgi:acetyl esterase/lipase